jgi:hypothetical protein
MLEFGLLNEGVLVLVFVEVFTPPTPQILRNVFDICMNIMRYIYRRLTFTLSSIENIAMKISPGQNS